MMKTVNVNNEKGSVLIPALMIMVLMTIMGFSIAATTTMGLKVAANKKYHKTAFISAESALSYVMVNVNLYGNDNSTVGNKIYFPDNSNPDNKYQLSSENDQFFHGSVEYVGSRMVPRGSGSEAGLFRAHDYQIACTGYGPVSSKSIVNSGFYRIGY
ncbi:hypothetical protein QUF90_08450 [Desulfococcaceae bacterium HSG9]|nr:hypothetical protein [Desulfococcaceae bacterium HSG9]